MLILLSLACTASDKDSGSEYPTPVVTILTPSANTEVLAGEPTAVSMVVDGFTLQDPAKHNDGQPVGHLRLTWNDGAETGQVETGSTQVDVTVTTPGETTLTATLLYADGDEVTEGFPDFVPASVTFTVQ